MKHKSLGGFSFIEIIMTVSILIIISMIAITYTDGMKDKTYNSKIISEVQSLENSFDIFLDETKTQIIPSGNRKYFTQDTGYAHDEIDAFGVSGFVTDTTIPKQYINYLPKDPRSNQYYAIASTFDSQEFEIAGIIKHNNTFQARLSGNYVGDTGPKNIIREYNGPNFVFDGSIKYLPYNPSERILTAKIHTLSGSVTVNKTYNTAEDILSLELFEGDIIDVGTGSFAEIYFSDGSISNIGDEESMTQLELSQMRYPEDHNLFTQVRLALNVGSIWTKASKLSDESVFEVYTTESVAAVRGTIFGVKKGIDESTNTVVIEGEVEVKKIPAGININNVIGDTNHSSNSGSGISENNLSINTITVEKNSPYQGIITTKDESSQNPNNSSTGAINSIPRKMAGKIKDRASTLNENIRIKVSKIEVTNTEKELTIQLNPTLRTATKVKIDSNSFPIELTGDSYTFTGNVLIGTGITNLKLCDNVDNCTSPLNIDLGINLSYTNNNDITQALKSEKKDNLICKGSEFTTENGTTICGENLIGEDWKVSLFAPFDSFGVSYSGNESDHYKKNYPLYGIRHIYGPKQSGGVMLLNKKVGIPFFTGGLFQNNSSLQNSDPRYQLHLASLENNNIQINKDNHIMKIGGIEGVFIDNTAYDSFLKYDFDDKILEGDFAIEMQVRNNALKRASGTYYLLDGGDGNKLYIKNGDLYLHSNSQPDYPNKGDLGGIQENGFSKIQLIQTSGKIQVRIDGETIISTMDILTNHGYYNIGNLNARVNQWNDIIDYVKIYQRSLPIGTNF